MATGQGSGPGSPLPPSLPSSGQVFTPRDMEGNRQGRQLAQHPPTERSQLGWEQSSLSQGRPTLWTHL